MEKKASLKKIQRGNFESNVDFLNKTGLLKKDCKILELGSGKGIMVKHLKDLGYDIVGTELNPEYREFAKKEYGIDLLDINAEKLLFADKKFDIVISFDVFEHIQNSDKHLMEVRRVLADGGYYLLATPNKLTNIPFEILKEKSFTKYKTYHISLHTFWQIRKRFLKNGFDINFENVLLVNNFFKEKIRRYAGNLGLMLIRIINPDSLPIFLKTNFYIIARKK